MGQDSTYPDHYSPELLEAIPRAASRQPVFGDSVPFEGVDIWTAYELSWLNPKGVPQVAIAEFRFLFNSANIIESKSFKYYLNSLNQTCFTSQEEVQEVLVKDLSAVSGETVVVTLFSLQDDYEVYGLKGECVDDLDITIESYTQDPTLLCVEPHGLAVENRQLYSNLLKTNCPVTGQPDWATVWVEYTGKEMSREGFLKYIVSLRQHQDFHETSVEQIFNDIQQQCKPDLLSVYARYTRRGGLDINPFRTNNDKVIPFGRCSRQ